MDARQLILRHGQKTERIIGSEVQLGGERKALQVLEGTKIVRVNAMLIELGAHCRDGVIDAPQRSGEPTRLQSGELVARGHFDRIEQAFVRRFAQPHERDLLRLTPADLIRSVPTARRSIDAGISPPYRARNSSRHGRISQALTPVVKRKNPPKADPARRPRSGYWARKLRRISLKGCVASRCPRWPTPSNTFSLAFAMRAASAC